MYWRLYVDPTVYIGIKTCLEYVKNTFFLRFRLPYSHCLTPPIGTFVFLLLDVVPQTSLYYGPLEVLGKEGHFFCLFCTTLSIFSFTMSIFFKKKTLPTFEETCWFKVTFWCDPKLEVSQLKIHLTQLNYKQTSRLLSKQMVRITFFSHDFTLFFYSAAKKKLKRG